MDNNGFHKIITKVFLFVPMIGILGLIVFVLLVSGAAAPDIVCFSMDSAGRLYVGKNEAIEVYEEGRQIGAISPKTSRAYLFRITEDDKIILSTVTKAYTMELDGTVINTWDEQGSDLYDSLENGRFQHTSLSGDIYQVKELLWWTKIVKNDAEIVYQISALSFATRIMLYVCAVSFVSFIAYMLYIAISRKYRLEVE